MLVSEACLYYYSDSSEQMGMVALLSNNPEIYSLLFVHVCSYPVILCDMYPSIH